MKSLLTRLRCSPSLSPRDCLLLALAWIHFGVIGGLVTGDWITWLTVTIGEMAVWTIVAYWQLGRPQGHEQPRPPA